MKNFTKINLAFMAKKKHFALLCALLCASMMGWAAGANEWIPYNQYPQYENKFKWEILESYSGPSNAVNLQGHNDFPCIYVTFADAAFASIEGCDAIIADGTHGADAWLKISSFTQQRTNVYVKNNNDEIRWAFTIYYEDGTPAVADTEKPVMTSATCSSTTHNSATIAVAATDNVGVTKYVVKNGGSELGEYTPSAGVIVVEDLTASTNYTLTVFAKDAAGNVSASGIDVACNTSAAPTNPYCNLEIGHMANPSADVNSFILLSVGSDGNGHTIVNIKQDNAKNSAMFDYINIVGKKEVGTDVVEGGSNEMAIIFNTPTPDGDGNITFTLQWSTINWTGRWQINNITVPADATCASADPFPGEHTYCKYTDNDLRREGANVTLTWATNNDGDVVVSLADGEGAHNTHFRNEGFEYGGGKTMDDSWFVYSGTNNATVEYASKYFTVYDTDARAGGNTYELRLKDGESVPANAVIAFLGHAFSWRTDEATNAYTENKIFAYTYGAICPFLDAPSNVAIDGTKHITFDAVANAQNYTAHVYLDGILKHRQNVSSGDALTFVPYTTGTYQVEVTASAAGYPTSDPSDAYNWALTADPVVVGSSEYCEWALPHDHDQDANLTIETDNDGDVTITLLPLDEQTAVFRANGMKLSDFKVGEVRTAASEYFNRTYTEGGSTVVLTLKDPDVKPGLGEKIYFSGYVECTVNGTSTWPTANLTYTYGSKCSGQKHVTVAVNNNEMGSATVDGEADVYVDAETQVTCVAVANLGYDFVNWTVGGVEVSTSATYTPTISVNTDLVANFEAHRNTYCRASITADNGATVYMTAKATGAVQDVTGYPQYRLEFEGMEGYAITGAANFNVNITHVNGNSGNTGFGNAAWTFVNNPTDYPYGMGYIEFYAENWREITFSNHYFYFAPNGVVILDSNFPAHINWSNTCIDESAPILTAPTAEALDESTIRLTLSAADDYSNMITYHIVCAAASVDESIDGASGATITKDYTGLTSGTTYEFTITAADGKTGSAHVSAPQICSATPVGDTEAPVISSFTATPSYGYVDLAITATDDMGNDLTFTITYGEGNVEVEGAPGAEVTKRIYALPSTDYSFSVVATDAASHTSAAAVAEATTLTIPAAQVPSVRPDVYVRSIYSDAYATMLDADFGKKSFAHNALTWDEMNVNGDLYLFYNLLPHESDATFALGGLNPGDIFVAQEAYQGDITEKDNRTTPDVSTMTHLHVDVWSNIATQYAEVQVNGHKVGEIPLTGSGWQQFDLPLETFKASHLADLKDVKYINFVGLRTPNPEEIAIDNVYFYIQPVEISFGDAATDNSDVISTNADKIADVTINRNISADDSWYTLCLPFDMDADKVNDVFGASTIATLESSEDRGSLIHLNFNYVDAIQAGKPYLIKPGQDFVSGTTISNVTIQNVNPSAEEYKAEATHMHFQGTFDKIMLTGEDKRYVSANNELYSPKPSDGSKIGAFRCYFTIPSGSSASAPGKQARIVFGPQNATGIDLINDSSKSNGKLLINGVLYIIRDGNTYNAQGMLIK